MNKTEAKRILTVGNHKLGNGIATFDLPATIDVCGRICKGCYAEKAQRIYPGVLPSREKKLKFSKTLAFPSVMVDAITAVNPEYIRIHSSGEFYSQGYITRWEQIAKRMPNVKFYAYTKRMDELDLTRLKSLPNVIIINSLHGGKINYGKVEQATPGMFICPDRKGSAERIIQPKGAICGITCTYCMTKSAQETGVYFAQH